MPIELLPNISLYIEAVKWAHELYESQRENKRYGGYFYTRHLAHIESVLWRFGYTMTQDSDYLAAAWLHDVLEDFALTKKDIVDQLGQEAIAAARLAWCVTDGLGKNRRERKQESYEKMQDYPWSIPLKLADRIANVESCINDKTPSLLNMYKEEYPEFRKLLYGASLNWKIPGLINNHTENMWKYLDELLEYEEGAYEER